VSRVFLGRSDVSFFLCVPSSPLLVTPPFSFRSFGPDFSSLAPRRFFSPPVPSKRYLPMSGSRRAFFSEVCRDFNFPPRVFFLWALSSVEFPCCLLTDPCRTHHLPADAPVLGCRSLDFSAASSLNPFSTPVGFLFGSLRETQFYAPCSSFLPDPGPSDCEFWFGGCIVVPSSPR